MRSFSQNFRRIFIILVVQQLLPAVIFCQADGIKNIQDQFDQYTRLALQEKVFVHTDKSFYLAGEVMWFKIYDVDGNQNKPLDLSKIAYVEVINQEQKPVLQAKISLKSGSGNGSFLLPLSLNSGAYKIRAYTNWMKNYSPDYYFETPVSIVNSLKNPGLKPSENATGYDIQFFPEGGNLVAGIRSKVAFRVVNQNGKGIDFKGALTDQNNDTVVLFQPLKFGIGYFYFTPSADQKYKALIKIGDNNIVISEVPAVYKQGYVMNMTDTGTNDQLNVTVSTNSSPQNQFVYLVAHTRQVVTVAEMQIINAGKAIFVIDKKKLGTGVSTLTVFTSSKEPVCERLYFRQPESLIVDANAHQEAYTSRKKVYVNIRTHDQADKPEIADMSMSVYLIDSLQSPEQTDILSYLWLTSDINGNIESPGYYFKNTGAEINEAIDNLMLTHGWRRFRWEDILQNKIPAFEFIPEYDGHVITGKVTDKKSGLPAENIITYLSVPGPKFELSSSISNRNGQIQFDIKDFYGSDEIVVQSDNQKDSMYRIDIANPYSEKFSVTPFRKFDLPESAGDQLLSHSISTQVQNAYLADSLQKFNIPETKDSTVFYGEPDKRYLLDDYTRFTTMEEVMREYVGEVTPRKHQGKFHFKVLAEPHRFFEDDPLTMIDGVPVFDVDKIIAFDPLKIRKLEIVTREYFLGPLVASGIVSYTTYKGDLEGFQFDPNSLVLEYEGLQLQREFYSPVYETTKQIQSRIPDFRNLLSWNPDIKTGKDGTKQLSFYTSDQPGKYIGVVQGITPGGKAGSGVFSFEVTK